MLQPDRFPEFFSEIYGHAPFPWQERLARRVMAEGWPQGIDLPTAAGKTACMDVAVYALARAAQQGQPGSQPRRVFFVVDRRTVVDQAHERARTLAASLEHPAGPLAREVAVALCDLAGSDTPLAVCRMRGGTVRDERWAIHPAQPAIITSTVDQLGSRMLFRGYGCGRLSRSVHAGLVGCDSLLLLDEAHCAVPFMQTANAVRRYAGPEWSEATVARPLDFVVLSATLPDDIAEEHRFPPLAERSACLDHPLLRQRLRSPKVAELVRLKKARQGDRLVKEAVARVARYVEEGRRRIAVMVNRVATAAAIHRQLSESGAQLAATPVLMTGRIRPLDRDDLLRRWSPVLACSPTREPEQPVVLVTTQCLEVGADFDFDALVTECASLDALRQRFGRLDRLGTRSGDVSAAVLMREADIKPRHPDPIYGTAMPATWSWLGERSEEDAVNGGGTPTFDFRNDRFEGDEAPGVGEDLIAPSGDAPVLLPTHVDFLCQTAPPPEPDPDVAAYLHGSERGQVEARVVFRADLDPERPEIWCDTVALLPPTAPEALAVPLRKLRAWLGGADLAPDDLTDVEGQPVSEEDERDRPDRFLLWRGRERSEVLEDPDAILPHDTVLVPADRERATALGHYFTRTGTPLDLAERASLTAGQQPVLRLHRDLPHARELADLTTWAHDEDNVPDDLRSLLADAADADLPPDLAELVALLERPRIENHPAGGCILYGHGHPRDHTTPALVALDMADEDDSTSLAGEAVSLEVHTADVTRTVDHFANCLLPAELAAELRLAAELHDIGKADDRFQALLHGHPVSRGTEPLAKSGDLPRTPTRRRRLRALADLPAGFRHELLSLQLVEAGTTTPSELVRHLVASHHGHARPFVPRVTDLEQPAVDVNVGGRSHALSQDDRRNAVPPHRLDSGIAERFWRLTRHYGWWGLAYLEAILRAADRHASAMERAR